MRRVACALVTVVFVIGMAVSSPPVHAQDFAYRSPEEINKAIKAVPGGTVHDLGKTPGGRDLLLLELGAQKSDEPAILVVANMEGDYPIASEAAVELAGLLAGDWKADLDSHRWYIVAMGNPDGHARYFARPVVENFVNDRPVNDDNDDATDEDGPDDLNGDGYITQMRQAHPEGKWVAVADNPVLLKEANEAKGEKGIWRLFTEGRDNDGDGKYNEDGSGGVNPGHNFPHNFEHYKPANGTWAASEVETRAILEFCFDHPEIAMAITFGRSNSLKSVPESSKKVEAADSKYKVPERFAEWMGVDPEVEYPIDELLKIAIDATGWTSLTEDRLLQWLGVGAAVKPDGKDVPYWTEITEKYKEFIKDAELDAERHDPPGYRDGTVQEWAYYQFGVPSFSMDFWTLPKVKKEEEKTEDGAMSPDDIEKMSNEDFIALGKEKIAEILKENNSPAHFTAAMVIKGLESGRMTTKRMAKFMREAKKDEEGGGADETEQALWDFDSTAFVSWKPFTHPTLGKVEIGGAIGYRDKTPPAADVPLLLQKQLPFLRDLAELLPAVEIKDVQIERRGNGVWKVEVWIANNGFLPFPTHQGERCQRPTPAVVTLSAGSAKLLEGKERNVLGVLSGSGGAEKVSWLLDAADGSSITIEATSFSAGGERRSVKLTGGGGR